MDNQVMQPHLQEREKQYNQEQSVSEEFGKVLVNALTKKKEFFYMSELKTKKIKHH